jgi:hypothetical protein
MEPPLTPSFESDPRITLEGNFYYPQEDLLQAFCRKGFDGEAEGGTGTSWNVVRPSYIIGAVRDNLLNHLVGLAVDAAVQAHLKRSL